MYCVLKYIARRPSTKTKSGDTHDQPSLPSLCSLIYMTFFLPRLVFLINMSKSKIGQSIHTTRSPETARERLDTTIKYPQVSSAPPPGTPKAILDTMNHPHYRSLVEDLKELGLADPNMPEDETNWKIDVVCSAREEIRLARQRLGPPPADNCGAAMKVCCGNCTFTRLVG